MIKMRAIVLIVAILLTSLTIRAQSLSLSDTNNQYENNDTLVVYGGDVSIDVHLFITNKSTNNLNVLLRKTIYTVMPGSYNYYCWGVCYPGDTLQSTNPVVIIGQQTDFLNFTGHYICNGIPGTAYIRYTFFDQQNSNDSVCINVEYHACLSLGVENVSDLENLLYPNPASTYINVPIVIEDLQKPVSFVEIHNAAGVLVRHIPVMDNLDVLTVPLNGYSEGIYFCSLYSGHQRIFTRKLIVKNP